MSPHITKRTEVYPSAPFPFACKENTIQPRQLSWLRRGVCSIPGDPAESLGTPAALPQLSQLLSISPQPVPNSSKSTAPRSPQSPGAAIVQSLPQTPNTITATLHGLGMGVKHLGEET